jgi:tRNA U55 pseudouridine synthase TruB
MPEADREAKMLPVDTLLNGLPAINVVATEAERLLLGQKLGLKQVKITGFARIYGPNQRFLGLVEVGEGGRTVPYRMLAQNTETSAATSGATIASMSDVLLEKTHG